MSVAFIPARKRASERGAGAGIISACSSVQQGDQKGVETCSSRSSEILISGSFDVDSDTQRL